MKKKTLLSFLSILFIAVNGHAQTFSEWFRQKATQKKYLIEQIAALKAYAVVLKKGYDISRDGLQVIGDIKNGDFNLHNDYFNSLNAPGPQLGNYPRAADIISLQQQIAALTAKSRSGANNSDMLTASEKSYINRVYERLQKDCLQTLSDLETVTTSGKVAMKDDERIERMDRLYKNSQSQYRFCRYFDSSLQLMVMQKSREQNEIQTLGHMHGTQ